jgi:Ribbon-helix-helix protein, copG family
MSQHLGFRCPDDIAEIIEQRVKATGKPRTDIIVELLRVGLLNKPVEQRETPVEHNTEYLQELIDNKTSYLADAMNEVKHSLESEIEALKTRLAQQEIRLGEF